MNNYNGGNNSTNAKMRVFKLIVQPDENSITVLKYLDSSIKTLNQMGVKFKIIKIDPEYLTPSFLKELEQNNVTRLPVVITDDNKYWIGYKEIKSKIYTNIKLFQENIQKEHILNQQLNNDPMGLNNMLKSINSPEVDPNDYLSNEMKYLRKNGDKYEFEDDSEEEIGGKPMDLRKATEEQEKARQINLSKSNKGKKNSNKFVDEETEIDFNPRKQKNVNNITPGFNNTKSELINEDMELLNKLGVGNYNSMNNEDGEALFKSQALLND